jgi:hypothetical protein
MSAPAASPLRPADCGQLWSSTAAELNRSQARLLLLIKSAQERMAGFLLEMAARSPGRDEVDLPMTRQDIGEYLGLTIETVSRTLTRMQESCADRTCGIAPRPVAPTVCFGTAGPLSPGGQPGRIRGAAIGPSHSGSESVTLICIKDAISRHKPMLAGCRGDMCAQDSGTRAMKYPVETIAVSLAALLALLGAAFARDDVFQTHMWVAFFALSLGAVMLLRQPSYAPATAPANIPLRDNGDTAYMDGPIRYGVIATMFWAIVGLLVGVAIAAQLAWPELNFEPWFNFGRMRPLHTSAVVFAFGGNALIATSFWVVQRTSRARLFGGNLAWFVFWGYQFFIVMAASGYLLGITQSREYAEPEWYVDIWLTLVWVAYLAVFLGTIVKRKEPHIYVANWFYLAFIVTIAMLHVVNNMAVPVSLFGAKSYSAFAGRAGCADPVVVRPQRRRLLPHRRLPRHDVLLRAEAGQPPDLFLPAVDHPFLVADLPLHLGRARITCTTPPCPTGPRRWAWCSRSCCGCPPGAA